MIEQKQKCEVELTFRFFSYYWGEIVRWQYEVDCFGSTIEKFGGFKSLDEAKQNAAERWGYSENLTY